jgi:hypothetical protein
MLIRGPLFTGRKENAKGHFNGTANPVPLRFSNSGRCKRHGTTISLASSSDLTKLAKIVPRKQTPDSPPTARANGIRTYNHKSTTAATRTPDQPLAEPDPVLRLLVGELNPNSEYLTQRLFLLRSSPLEDAELFSHFRSCNLGDAPPLIRLPSIDPHAFELYCEYLRFGEIGLTRHLDMKGGTTKAWSWAKWWPLLNAYVLSMALWDDKFGRQVMRLLEDMMGHGQPGDPEPIHHLFTTPGVSQEIKNVVVDILLGGTARSLSPKILALYPESFIYAASKRARFKLDLAIKKGHSEAPVTSGAYTQSSVDVAR